MVASALDCSLALARSPRLASALRARALPDDIGVVLDVAAGGGRAIEAGCLATGADAAELQEAARFYVQQVLLHPDADAYRVLGLTDDATTREIKRHYLTLQRWLHPDRVQGPEAAYATRVNQAWNELRHPGRRARYDARRSAAIATAGAYPMLPMRAPHWWGVPVEERPRIGAVAAAVALVLLLAWLAWTLAVRELAGPDVDTVYEPSLTLAPAAASPVATSPSDDVDKPDSDARTGSGDHRPGVGHAGRVTHSPADGANQLFEHMGAAGRGARPRKEQAPTTQSDTRTVRAPDTPGNTGPASRSDFPEPARARARVDQLLAFIGDARKPSPPVWATVSAMEAGFAAQLANTRHGVAGVAWSELAWEEQGDVLRARFRQAGQAGRPAVGEAGIALVWRDGDWWVAQVDWREP